MDTKRSAIIAGILSGLGIRPRRPRAPLERLDAAMRCIEARQTTEIERLKADPDGYFADVRAGWRHQLREDMEGGQ